MGGLFSLFFSFLPVSSVVAVPLRAYKPPPLCVFLDPISVIGASFYAPPLWEAEGESQDLCPREEVKGGEEAVSK